MMQSTKDFSPIDQYLFDSRTVFINGSVNFNLAHEVNRQIFALEQADPKKPIVLWINSPGGEVYSGFSIYDAAQFVSCRVITVVSGMAMSMGSVISLAAEKNDRFILPNSKVLIHQPLLGGAFHGQASDIVIHAQDMQKLKEKLHGLYAERTGTAKERFVELMERDCFITPEEAIELGLVSKVINSREELNKLISA